MANVDTLPEILRPLMEGPSIETPRCAVCGAHWPLNRHHIVRRGAGKLFRDGREVPKPTVMLCGSGNASGCHGLAHANRLHFRWVGGDDGHWERKLTPKACRYQDALADESGWGRLL